MADEKFNIGPQARDIDFYIGGIIASAFISSNISTTANGTKIALASSSIGITSGASIVSKKIGYTAILLDSSTTVSTISSEILKGLIHSDSTTSVTVSVKKIAYAGALITSSISVSGVAKRITKASSHPDIVTSVTSSGRQIRVAGAISSSITTTVSIGAKEILKAQINIPIKARTIINSPTRFSPGYVDSSDIKVFLILDGKPLTDHNRTLDVSISPAFVETRNWHNKKNRYYKRAGSSGRKTFTLSWKSLPNLMDYTVDTRHGRDFLASVAEDADSHVLKIVNQDQSGLTPYTEATYTVFVNSYSETLTRRYIDQGVYLYDCNLTLEEA